MLLTNGLSFPDLYPGQAIVPCEFQLRLRPKLVLVRQLPQPQTTIRFLTGDRANPHISKRIRVSKDIRPKEFPPFDAIWRRRTWPRPGGVLPTTFATLSTRTHGWVGSISAHRGCSNGADDAPGEPRSGLPGASSACSARTSRDVDLRVRPPRGLVDDVGNEVDCLFDTRPAQRSQDDDRDAST